MDLPRCFPLVALLGASLALAACGSSVPVAAEAPARTEPDPVEAEPSLPPPPVPEPTPAPPPPPAAPKGSIESRSLYPSVGIAEWTLANGLRVVFKDLDDGFVVRGPSQAEVPGGPTSADVEVVGAPTLQAAIAAAEGSVDPARVASTVLVVVGPADPEVVEGWVGTRLAGPRTAAGGAGEIPVARSPVEIAVPVGWSDLPVALVLRSLVAFREAASAEVSVSPASRELRVGAGAADDLEAVLRPATDAEIRIARSLAENDRGASTWAEVLAFLYAEPGDYRPARRPEAAADALARLGAVPPATVNALLDRLRASLSR